MKQQTVDLNCEITSVLLTKTKKKHMFTWGRNGKGTNAPLLVMINRRWGDFIKMREMVVGCFCAVLR